MRNIVKIVLCFMFVLAFASFAQAQKVRTVTGDLCGNNNSGAAVGTIYLRVGTEIVEITHLHTLFHGDRGTSQILTKLVLSI